MKEEEGGQETIYSISKVKFTMKKCGRIEFLYRARIGKRLRSPRIDFKESIPGGPVREIGLSHRPARLHRLAESFLGIDSWAPPRVRAQLSGSNAIRCNK